MTNHASRLDRIERDLAARTGRTIVFYLDGPGGLSPEQLATLGPHDRPLIIRYEPRNARGESVEVATS
jgi:hypothetical protein